VGGLLSLAGALANAELGAMYPHAGSDYVYLREAYHPPPGRVAVVPRNLHRHGGDAAIGFAARLQPFVTLGPTQELLVAVAVIVATTAVNYVSVPAGARFNNLMGYNNLKVTTLVAQGVGGLLLVPGRTAPPPVATASAAAFGLALSPILFSYLGWNASVYVASEIRDPERNVPRSLFVGLAVCTVIYLLTNAPYLAALPITG
jgi:basic amino acid/polyamine antiporter, APA family